MIMPKRSANIGCFLIVSCQYCIVEATAEQKKQQLRKV